MPKYTTALFYLFFAVFSFTSVSAQSINQNYPTPVSSNVLNGTIAARDIGDARLTTYFFTFDGSQGDVFINVKTENLDGDIDVFTRDNLRPLTKITVIADPATGETGRVIYLRKPEKLILRIQGRTPNDEAATFNLRFAGSFVAVQPATGNDLSGLPEIRTESQTDIRVNSVGTIIEVKPTPRQTVAQTELPPENVPKNEAKAEAAAAAAKTNARKRAVRPARKPARKTVESSAATVNSETSDASDKNKEPEKPPVKNAAPGNRRRAERNAAGKNSSENKKASEPNPLENVRLIIELKDGTKIERVMSEVLRVGVDKGTLTLITKDGRISRYSILDVSRMTIE